MASTRHIQFKLSSLVCLLAHLNLHFMLYDVSVSFRTQNVLNRLIWWNLCVPYASTLVLNCLLSHLVSLIKSHLFFCLLIYLCLSLKLFDASVSNSWNDSKSNELRSIALRVSSIFPHTTAFLQVSNCLWNSRNDVSDDVSGVRACIASQASRQKHHGSHSSTIQIR